jgi:hypothetical protein
MSGLLTDRPEDSAKRRTCRALYVNGVRHATSAAKFWPALIDEIRLDFPHCDRFELSAPGGGLVNPSHLFPEQELAHELENLDETDLERAILGTIAEMELFGPPPPVQARLFAGERELLARALPEDCLDGDILPYLIAWLLAWAGVPETQWEGDRLTGGFSATDRGRHLLYTVAFDFTQTHLSEGLYQRAVSVQAGAHTAPAHST